MTADDTTIYGVDFCRIPLNGIKTRRARYDDNTDHDAAGDEVIGERERVLLLLLPQLLLVQLLLFLPLALVLFLLHILLLCTYTCARVSVWACEQNILNTI